MLPNLRPHTLKTSNSTKKARRVVNALMERYLATTRRIASSYMERRLSFI